MPNSKGAPKSTSQSIKGLNILHEGWVLKKKRKKMQGESPLHLP